MTKPLEHSKIERLIALLAESHRLMRERFRRDKSRIDPFTMIRLDVLRLIAAERPTMKDIAEYLHVTAPSATSMIGGLVRQGYARRAKRESDRRIVRLEVTAKGREALRENMKRMLSDAKKLLSEFSEKDVDSLVSVFSRLVESEKNKNISK